MKKIFLITAIAVAGTACDKEDIVPDKTAAELLTQKEWILTGHGFDSNSNNILDAGENVIENCQMDNSYLFRTDGTGSAFDNAVTCGAPVNSNFEWQLLNNNTELEIEFEKLSIIKINEQQLVLNPILPGLSVKYLLVYRH
jgi:hypothetical protein